MSNVPANFKNSPFVPVDQQQFNRAIELLEYIARSEQKRQLEQTEVESVWFFQYKETFKKLRSYVKELEETFENYAERICSLGAIKDEVDYLIKQLDKDLYKYERRLCIVIYDSIIKVKAEDLTYKHLEVLRESFEVLFRGQCDQTQFKQVEKALRKCGLNWIVGGTYEGDIS
ncbi:hypothetical protein [Paenibacillus senegalimassiliensis]|uniref:hypothetical protein n=1 Tax=Paenibacillus senegalimassiliensis TaxID=1737426 RepID=UPI00073E501D|nr:hypothetical protein [Paenibacillus senegalimassiliensis]